ncbi:hypothetical protein DSUL_60268 [Desulfovibrionales bacterium]
MTKKYYYSSTIFVPDLLKDQALLDMALVDSCKKDKSNFKAEIS